MPKSKQVLETKGVKTKQPEEKQKKTQVKGKKQPEVSATNETTPPKKGRGRPKKAVQEQHDDEIVKQAAQVSLMSVQEYYNFVANKYELSDIVFLDKHDLQNTKLVREEAYAYESELRQSMLDNGWIKDSVCLVTESPANEKKQKKNPRLHDMQDGNTRLRSAMKVQSINKIPCRVIKLPEGQTSIPMEHLLVLSRQKNYLASTVRAENFVDFLVSFYNVFNADKAKSDEELAASDECKEHLVKKDSGPNPSVNWVRARALLHYKEGDNKLKSAFRVYQHLSNEELAYMVSLSKTREIDSDPWSISKCTATEFLNADPDVRHAAMLANSRYEILSENAMNAFCVKKMVEKYVERVCADCNVQKAAVTTAVMKECEATWERSHLYSAKDEKRYECIKALVSRLAGGTEPGKKVQPERAVNTSKVSTLRKTSGKATLSKRTPKTAEKTSDAPAGILAYKNQRIDKWTSTMVGLALTAPHLVDKAGMQSLDSLFGRVSTKATRCDYILYHPRIMPGKTFVDSLQASFFSIHMTDKQTLIVVCPILDEAAATVASFAGTTLNRVGDFVFFQKKIKAKACKDENPVGTNYYVYVYRKQTKLAHYSPGCLDTRSSAHLEHSRSVPINFEPVRPVTVPGSKVPLYPQQAPLSLYDAIFDLLIPEGTTSVMDINSNVGTACIAAMKRNIVWFGVESHKKMREHFPLYLIQAVARIAGSYDYFVEWLSLSGMFGDRNKFMDLDLTLAADQLELIEKNGPGALLDMFDIDGGNFEPVFIGKLNSDESDDDDSDDSGEDDDSGDEKRKGEKRTEVEKDDTSGDEEHEEEESEGDDEDEVEREGGGDEGEEEEEEKEDKNSSVDEEEDTGGKKKKKKAESRDTSTPPKRKRDDDDDEDDDTQTGTKKGKTRHTPSPSTPAKTSSSGSSQTRQAKKSPKTKSALTYEDTGAQFLDIEATVAHSRPKTSLAKVRKGERTKDVYDYEVMDSEDEDFVDDAIHADQNRDDDDLYFDSSPEDEVALAPTYGTYIRSPSVAIHSPHVIRKVPLTPVPYRNNKRDSF